MIFAALVAPSVVHLRDNQVDRDAVPSVERLIGYAREASISKRTTALMTYDSSTRTLTVKEDSTVDPNAVTVSQNSVTQGAGTTPLPVTGSNLTVTPPTAPVTPDPDNPLINKSVVLPADFSISTFQLASNQVDETSFQLHFYTDGTCDSGGISLSQGSATKSITIDDFGRYSEADGDLPEATDSKWPAGQFEPRQNATQ